MSWFNAPESDAYYERQIEGKVPDHLDQLVAIIHRGASELTKDKIAAPFITAAESLRAGVPGKKVGKAFTDELGITTNHRRKKHSDFTIHSCVIRHLCSSPDISPHKACDKAAEELEIGDDGAVAKAYRRVELLKKEFDE